MTTTSPSEPRDWAEALATLAGPAAGIWAALDAWDAVSDSLCDKDGVPLDDTAYGDGQAHRDAAAWEAIAPLLRQGPAAAALDDLERHASTQAPDPVRDEILHSLPALRDCLASCQELQQSWLTATSGSATPQALQQATDDRNADAWHDMVTLAEITARLCARAAPATSAGTCPRHGAILRPRAATTAEQAWCGTWTSCPEPGCHHTQLQPSQGLRTDLDAQCVSA